MTGSGMTVNVLILCTHNSARSVLAERMLNHWATKLGKDVRACQECHRHSTVTLLARFLGLSTSVPFARAA